MYSIESIDLGTYRGDEYFLVGYVEPEPEQGEDYDPDRDAENYGVSLVQTGVGLIEENAEIARMDTYHGQPHLDKEYLPPDADEAEKVLLEEGYTIDQMKRYFLENWQSFADQQIHYNE